MRNAFGLITSDEWQQQIDAEGRKFEQAFETWRGWAQQNALAEAEHRAAEERDVSRPHGWGARVLLFAFLAFGLGVAIWEMWR